MSHSEAFVGEAIESVADEKLRDVVVDAAQRGTEAVHPAVANGPYDVNRVRADFPALAVKVRGKSLVYFVRQRTRILAIAAVASAAAGVAIAVGHPQEVSEPILGNEWQCSRVPLVTTCVRVGEQNGPLHNDAALADLTDGRAPSTIAVARRPRGQMDHSQ